jgi:hypothetical protein
MTDKPRVILTNDFSGDATCRKCIKASNAMLTGKPPAKD